VQREPSAEPVARQVQRACGLSRHSDVRSKRDDGNGKHQRGDGRLHICGSSQDLAFMSDTVSCRSATFMRRASSRLVWATNEFGSVFSAVRLSSIARSIDARLCAISAATDGSSVLSLLTVSFSSVAMAFV
jgi:hypothetical protein